MVLFLQGDSGVGKSCLLRDILTPHTRQLAGFSVQRLCENGRVIGFRAVGFGRGYPPPEAEYEPNGQEGVFLLHGRQSVCALEAAALEAEREAPDRRLVLLDEIGGVELRSPVFLGALRRILSGRTPCAGVFKSRENLERMAAKLALDGEYRDAHQELETMIRRGGALITVTTQNRDALRAYLTKRLVSLFE